MKLMGFLLLALWWWGCGGGEDGYVAVWSGSGGSKNIDKGAGIEDGVGTLNDSTLYIYRCRWKLRAGKTDTLFKQFFRFDPQKQAEAFNVAQLASGYEYLNPSARVEYHQQIHLLRPISRQEALP